MQTTKKKTAVRSFSESRFSPDRRRKKKSRGRGGVKSAKGERKRKMRKMYWTGDANGRRGGGDRLLIDPGPALLKVVKSNLLAHARAPQKRTTTTTPSKNREQQNKRTPCHFGPLRPAAQTPASQPRGERQGRRTDASSPLLLPEAQKVTPAHKEKPSATSARPPCARSAVARRRTRRVTPDKTPLISCTLSFSFTRASTQQEQQENSACACLFVLCVCDTIHKTALPRPEKTGAGKLRQPLISAFGLLAGSHAVGAKNN